MRKTNHQASRPSPETANRLTSQPPSQKTSWAAVTFCVASLVMTFAVVAMLPTLLPDNDASIPPVTAAEKPIAVTTAAKVSGSDANQQESATDNEPKLPPDTRSNIVLINLDDAQVDLLSEDVLEEFLPNMNRLAGESIRFTNCHVTTPLCGPSRTCLLYSRHAHQSGVRANREDGPMNNGYHGGFPALQRVGIADDHIGRWMQQTGYRTMFIGKYLHDIPAGYAPSGWDQVLLARGDRYYATYYSMARHEQAQKHWVAPATQFRTDYESDMMVDFLEFNKQVTAQRRQPFFMYLAPMAPHEPGGGKSMIAPRHLGAADHIEMPITPDFDEFYIEDKPPQFQKLETLRAHRTGKMHETYRRRIEALMSVDDQIGDLMATLKHRGELANTTIMLTSDHGYLLGHHRMTDKQVPYDRSTRVPLFVWQQQNAERDMPQGEEVRNHLVSHLDFAPTFLEMAGATPRKTAGKSFAALFNRSVDGKNLIDENDFRQALLIQNFERKRMFMDVYQCAYTCLRMVDKVFVQWANGEQEFYDLAADPWQLKNAIDSLSKQEIDSYQDQLIQLRQEQIDTSEPHRMLTLSQPTAFEPFAESEFRVAGMAEADEGIATVEIQIKRIGAEAFFDGSRFQAKPVWIAATVATHRGSITQWEYSMPDEVVSPANAVEVAMRATTMDGTKLEEPSSVYSRPEEPEAPVRQAKLP